jgi:hypothetical protein
MTSSSIFLALLWVFGGIAVVIAVMLIGVWLRQDEEASDVQIELTPRPRPNVKKVAKWN